MATQSSDSQTHKPALDLPALQELGHALLLALGQDPNRPGLRETPRRWASFWQEFLDSTPNTNLVVTFEAITTDQMVVVSGIPVWSLCEHHLLPFHCRISIGYIARKHVLGLSKFARIAHRHAHTLQLQERLVHDIADDIETLTHSSDIGVIAHGWHLCMIMRGVKTPATMTTSILRGKFRQDPSVRAEFLALAEEKDPVPF